MYVVSMVNRVPFAAGARDCLGMKFAIMEAVLALATFMHRYLIVGSMPKTMVIRH